MDSIRKISTLGFKRRGWKNSHFDSYEFNITNTSMQTDLSALVSVNIKPFLKDKYSKDIYSAPFAYVTKVTKEACESKFESIIVPHKVNGKIITYDHVNIIKGLGHKVIVNIDLTIKTWEGLKGILRIVDTVLETLPDGVIIKLEYNDSNHGEYYTDILERINEDTCGGCIIRGLFPNNNNWKDNYGYDLMLYHGISSGGYPGTKGTWYIVECESYNSARAIRETTDGNVYLYERTVGLDAINNRYNMLSDRGDNVDKNDVLTNVNREISLIKGICYE